MLTEDNAAQDWLVRAENNAEDKLADVFGALEAIVNGDETAFIAKNMTEKEITAAAEKAGVVKKYIRILK